MFGKNKNYEAILTNAKRVFGLAHDATEAEVDQALEDATPIADLRATIEQEESQRLDAQGAQLQADLETAQGERDQARTDLDAANARITELEASLATAQGERDQARTDLQAANTRIAELEKDPATEHTNGPGGEGVGKATSKTPLWDKVKAQHGL